MARILIKGEWYEQVEPSTFSESELEQRVVLHAPSVYPEYLVVPFKLRLDSDYGKFAPDLIFIAKNLREWKLVEIEMGYHPLTHVEQQVQQMSTAIFTLKEVQYIHEKLPGLDFNRLSALIVNTPPDVLVIINEPKPEWKKPLTRHRAIIAVFELFRSETNHEIFRVNGEYPTQYIETISACSVHPWLSSLLCIQEPDKLGLPLRSIVRLRYNNCITEWQRTDADGKVFLNPTGRSPLPDTRFDYEIFRQGDGVLTLRRR